MHVCCYVRQSWIQNRVALKLHLEASFIVLSFVAICWSHKGKLYKVFLCQKSVSETQKAWVIWPPWCRSKWGTFAMPKQQSKAQDRQEKRNGTGQHQKHLDLRRFMNLDLWCSYQLYYKAKQANGPSWSRLIVASYFIQHLCQTWSLEPVIANNKSEISLTFASHRPCHGPW